ncbi:glycine betaine ABC transporter substrate-binding protein [Lentibacillus saliphilus]|uniref:glycine betaine ABC transporter substrate-binding protein n=1 Tax=Lentibacillus saliphilus TaxID=2737028 RepID=UPI001FE7EE11|nr:glycine betaine ABC transporter substrate-binding protein [Lentibacillus saliphilus]
MLTRKRFYSMLIVATMLLLFTACNTSNEQEEELEKGTIKIGMNNWAENIAVSNMWKILLDEKGYDTELVQVEKAVMYQGLASNDLDIGMEIWLPSTDQSYYEEYKDDIELRDTWYKGTALALTVPSYMTDINSITDLNDIKDLFDSNIVGIDPGSSIMSITEDVIAEYNLDFTLTSASEPAMLADLNNKYDNEEPIVVTLWKPHSSFANLDLKMLDDPKNLYGDSEEIYYASRLELEKDHPDVVKWFDTFFLEDDQLGSLMAAVEGASSEAEGAQHWIDDNRDLINEWFVE